VNGLCRAAGISRAGYYRFRQRGKTKRSSLTIPDRPRRKPGCRSKTGRGLGFTTCATRPSNWLVNKAKVEPKTVQSILRHSRIQTTLGLYTQEESDEARAAQGEFLQALGMCSELVQ
jgi:hypothetical protein